MLVMLGWLAGWDGPAGLDIQRIPVVASGDG